MTATGRRWLSEPEPLIREGKAAVTGVIRRASRATFVVLNSGAAAGLCGDTAIGRGAV